MFEASIIIRMILSFAIGGILGLQREKWGKWAGPRTFALVAGGSTLFTILSVSSFGADIARVAANIVVGIGFLGAGTILHKEGRVEGLTTAAGLWMVSAIGMAVGLGYYLVSVIIALIVLIIFMFNITKIQTDKDKDQSGESDGE